LKKLGKKYQGRENWKEGVGGGDKRHGNNSNAIAKIFKRKV
jgi:hypothetical protein